MDKTVSKKICIIIVYFGIFPNYFQLWLNSCKYNNKINFLLFTDNETKYEYPSNVKVIYTSFQTIKNKIQSIFDFTINLKTPYKLCDYKPTYGSVFQEYLKGYDYWGHCDLDIIFGNLTNFINDELLSKYDKIFANGHFSIYKNEKRINESFRKLLDNNSKELYKKVFTDEKSYCFDETPGIVKLYDGKKYKIYKNKSVLADISVKYNNFIVLIKEENGKYIFNWYSKNKDARLMAIYMKNGKLQSEEIMYIHLQKRKMKMKLRYNDKFYIIPNKFINIDDGITVKNFKKINYSFTRYRFEYFLIIFNRIKSKILRNFRKIRRVRK